MTNHYRKKERHKENDARNKKANELQTNECPNWPKLKYLCNLFVSSFNRRNCLKWLFLCCCSHNGSGGDYLLRTTRSRSYFVRLSPPEPCIFFVKYLVMIWNSIPEESGIRLQTDLSIPYQWLLRLVGIHLSKTFFSGN